MHISLREHDRRREDFRNNKKIRLFLVMPFSLSPESYVFAKVVRPLFAAVYLNDGVFGSPPKKHTAFPCLHIRRDLEDADFTINEGESALYPVQEGE